MLDRAHWNRKWREVGRFVGGMGGRRFSATGARRGRDGRGTRRWRAWVGSTKCTKAVAARCGAAGGSGECGDAFRPSTRGPVTYCTHSAHLADPSFPQTGVPNICMIT